MTIDEAVEIRREQAQAIVDAIEKTESENSTEYKIRDTNKFNFALAEPYEVADEYLRLTDPTPLKVELIEQELGKPDGFGLLWVGDYCLRWCPYLKRITVDGFVNGFSVSTLGHLRQIVAMLRGGGE